MNISCQVHFSGGFKKYESYTNKRKLRLCGFFSLDVKVQFAFMALRYVWHGSGGVQPSVSQVQATALLYGQQAVILPLQENTCETIWWQIPALVLGPCFALTAVPMPAILTL
jgi:hypothetical protein